MSDQTLRHPFSRRPVSVVLGGRLYESPYRSAGAWLEILEVTPLDSLTLAALDSEDRWDVQDKMLDGEIRAPELATSAQALLKQITGYERWWIGYRLAVAAMDPAILGPLILAGLRSDDVTLPQWCAATYALLTRNASSEDKFKVDAHLDVPLAGVDPGTAWDDMGMSAAEMRAMADNLPGMR